MKISTIPTPSEQTDLIMEVLQFRRSGETTREAKAMTRMVWRFWPFLESLTVNFLSRNNSWDLLAKDDALSVSKIAFMAAVSKWDPAFGKEPSRLISQYVIGYLETAITRSDA